MTSGLRLALRLLALVVAGGIAPGCASDPGPRPTPIRAENLFISPSGEPFHGGDGDPYVAARWFAQADADHDGRITRTEFFADAERAFRRFDVNGDGVIDGLEIAAYEDKTAPEILPRIAALAAGDGMDPALFGGRGRASRDARPRKARAGDRAGQGAGLLGYLDEPEPLTAADADLDGKVTRSEWMRRSETRFDILTSGGPAITLSALPKTIMQSLWERQVARAATDRRTPRP